MLVMLLLLMALYPLLGLLRSQCRHAIISMVKVSKARFEHINALVWSSTMQ